MNSDEIFIFVDGRQISLAALLAEKRHNAKTVYAGGCTGLTALPDLPNAEIVDVRGCTGLTALPDLPNAEYVCVPGCTGLTALPDLPNAEYVYASGCTGLTALPDLPNAEIEFGGGYFFAGVDSRGYPFEGVTIRNEWRVVAGCRNYNIAEAREHWGPGGPSDRPDCLAMVEAIAAFAAAA